jgi:LmbE family N-acetylglucosaminyl deacetylase
MPADTLSEYLSWRSCGMNKKIVVFSPHPDDETVGCGGIIAKRLSEGYTVLIVIMTDGRHAFSRVLGIDSNPSPEELKEIRKEEVKRATKILGVPEKDVVFLDFEDGKLEENAEKAEKIVTETLKKNWPEEVYFPYEKDSHEDHRVTNRIVRNSIEKLGLPVLKYQYSIAQRFSRTGPILDRFHNFFNHHIVRVDISEFLSLKESAMKEFKSEIGIISQKQKRPVVAEFKKYLKRSETFYVHE